MRTLMVRWPGMEKSMLLNVIGDTTENKVLDFLIEGVNFDYSKKHIADNCKISRPTLCRALPRLVKEGLVKPTRKIGRYSFTQSTGRTKESVP